MREGRRWWENAHAVETKREEEGLRSIGSDLDRKFWVALTAFAILGALAWFTLGEGTVLVGNRPVEIRLLPVIVVGGLALRTVLARQAERIRRGGDEDSK